MVVAQVLQSEEWVPFSRAAREFAGRRVNPATLWRWATNGVVDRRTGERVRLEALRVGGVWTTSREAVARFIERTSGAELPTVEAPRRACDRDVRRAEAELAAAGV